MSSFIASKIPGSVSKGDILRVIYHGAPTALMIVTKVNNYSIEGLDGETKCRITLVGISTELRFYAELSPNRQTVLRHVKVVNVSESVVQR